MAVQARHQWFMGQITALSIFILLGASTSAAAEVQWAPYDYTLRSGENIQAEMGTLVVPARRTLSDTATTILQFVRLPTTGDHPGSPIIYLAGGPGSSGIDAGRGDRWRLFESLRRQGDVILLDQRGVGLSSPPPECSTPWSFPNDQASDEGSFNASLEEASSLCAREWRAAGVDLQMYNTAENAADVADLARALGGRVRLVGISYGTFLAFAVLRDHGDVVERVVLAGTEGPDDTLKLPLQADRAFDRLSARVAANPLAAALTPHMRQSLETIIARLEREPVWGEGQGRDGAVTRVLISKYDVQLVTFFLSATSENAVRLPALIAAAEQGDYSGMARMVLFLRRFFAPLPAMPLAMDAASPVSSARQHRARSQTERSIFENAANVPSANFASALGITQLAPRWRSRLRTSVPAYFISGDLDSRTPPENAEAVRRGFRSSAHLVLHGAGHDNDLFLSSPIILDRINAFLNGERLRDEEIEVDILRFE